MNTYLNLVSCLLVLVLLFGLARQLYGPTQMDRIVASQLFGTLGVAILILQAVTQSQAALINVAMVLALLAPLALILFVRLGRRQQ
jgi:multicomponent Na+:H+ antiporter subunit F